MKVKSIYQDAAELGLSYGQYIGYRDCGYLETYRRIKQREDEERKQMANVIHSNIIGGDRASSSVEHNHSKRKGETIWKSV